MSTQLKNLSSFDESGLPDCSKLSIGIIVSEFNEGITSALAEGAYETLVQAGVKPKRIITQRVPGAFELPLAALMLGQKDRIDAVICLGCVIKGETPHFDFVCQAAAQGIMDVGLKLGKPVVFGVLTTLDFQQAQDRAGGKYGNKGIEAAVTAIKMLSL